MVDLFVLMICQDFLSWHDRFLFQMFDNPKIWDKSIYAWNCFDLWRLMQRAKAFFRQELYYSHGAQKKCCLCQGVSHSCFFGRNELLWVQRDQPPKDDTNQVKDWIRKFRFADLNRPRGVEWPVLFFVYWSCTAQVGSTDELRGAFCVDL